jgi:putative ABC transport system permease protein
MKRRMIISGLRARPVRTTVGVLAVALEVILILVIIGLADGISTETARRTEGVGADIWLQPPNSSLFLALSPSTMPLGVGDKMKELEGVKAVAPIQTLVNSSAGLEVIYGINMASFEAMSSGFVWREGGPFKGPDEVIVDDIYQEAKSVKVGDKVELIGHTFKVAGVVEHGRGARLFIPFETAAEMTGREGKASVFFIKLNNPDQVHVTVDRIKQLLKDYTVIPLNEYAKLMMSNNMPALNAFISSVVFISLCVGVLVIFLSMYTTITERTREIGILRSLGASKAFIVSLIFQESFVVCLAGALVGIGASFAIAAAIQLKYPTLLVMISPAWTARALGFALLSGIIGSFYPSLKAAAQDPVEALAYE